MLKNHQKLKPVEYDVHLKYLCPKCGLAHWLSWQETQTQGFKIVCDCSSVFSVKRTIEFKIKYYKNAKTNKKKKTHTTPLKTAMQILVGYGFTEAEVMPYLEESHNNNPSYSYSDLVKATLVKMKGDTDVK